MRLPCLLAPLALTLASGCAALGAQPSRVGITSDPPGAEVYVMGGSVGLTPLTLDENTIFPLTYPSEKQALYGAVELRKPGCSNAVQRVGTRALDKGVHVKLDCAEVPVATEKLSIESRLKQLRELRDKGLITEQEAREIRQRILGEL